MIVRSDGEIQAAVLDELAWNSQVTVTSIGVSVRRRVVTLTGTVRSDAERQVAEADVRRLYGVADVINSIEVQQPLRRQAALVTEGLSRGAALVPANHLAPVMRARRLDFIVLEHDEDLIGPTVRAAHDEAVAAPR